MNQIAMDQLPEVQLYTIGPEEVSHAAPLLTAEAVEYIREGAAFGMALVEEGEARAAVCARLLPENEAVLDLISLYVAPAYRRRGLGGTLLMELLDETMEATDGSLRWVTASFAPGAEGLESLLSKAGFQIEQDQTVASWQLPVGSLEQSVLMKRSAPPRGKYSLRTLEELSNYHIRQLVQRLKKHRVDDLTPAEMRQALPKASHVLFDPEGQPTACAIFTAKGDGTVFLSQFFVAGGSATAALTVLQAGAKALLAQFPENTLLEIPTLTASSARLVQALLPSSQAVYLNRAVLNLADF